MTMTWRLPQRALITLAATAMPIVMITVDRAPAAAQEFRGTIDGRVTDTSNASLPGVAVTGTHLETGVRVAAVTNAQGRYLIPLLPPGRYRVSAELQGFKRVERTIDIRVDDHVTVDLVLELGQITEVIDVGAETPLLDSGTGSTGQVIDGKRLELMPLSDGNPFYLTRLAAGVAPFGDLRYFRPFDNNAVAEFSASGGSTANAYTIDGAPNQAHRQGNADARMAFTPPAAAVEEFKVQTVSFDAAQGRSSGATVNVAMKSGTNTYKGEGYYYYRSEELAETDFFIKLRGQPEPALDYTRPGFALGGPVQIPRLFDGKNRTFFFTSVEWLNDKFPDASQRSVPTEKMRTGDFSELLPLGIRIYDPATAVLRADGRVERQPFPGNIIPANRISPIAREILKYYPLPNQPGDSEQRVNYFSNVTRDDDFYTMNFRVDHQLADAHKMFVRYSHNNRRETRGHWAGEVNGVRPTGFYSWRINDALGLDYIWTLGPSSLINVRGSWGRFQEFDHRQNQPTFDPASLGFSAQTAALFDGFRYFPQIDLDRFDDLGANYLGGVTTNAYAFQPTWTKLTGTHSVRAGYDLRVTREDEGLDGHPAGLYQFRGNFTRQLDNGTNQHGQDLASLLLGIPTGGRIETAPGTRFNQVFYHGLFVQDDWRVSNRLTLNLGLRYEYEGAPTERFNRNVRGFDPTAPISIAAAAQARYAAAPIPEVPVSDFVVRGGVRFVDDQHRGFWDADRNNFQPRIGVAYQLDKKTVLRGGWAIYTTPAYVDGARPLGLIASTPITASNDRGLSFRANLATPFPDGKLAPLGQTPGADSQLGQDISDFFDDIDFRNGQIMRWVVSYERELPGRWIAEASYVGAHGYDLLTAIDLNALPTQYLSRAQARDPATIDFLNFDIANPFAGLMPTSAFNGTTIDRHRLLRAYPQFENIEGKRYDGGSSYHGLQLKLDKRFSRGFSLLTSYSYSASKERITRLNPGDDFYEARLARNDIPHRVVVNPIWELPFGATGRGVMRGLIGGWSVAALWQYETGQPLTLLNSFFTGDLSALRASVSTDTVGQPVFDTNGFYFHDALVQTGGADDPAKQRTDARIDLDANDFNYRTLPTRVGNLRGTPLNYWDLSIVKRVTLGGRVRAQLKIEVYNATNFVWFNAPNLDQRSADFGKVTNTRNLPRNVQIGGRITF